MNRIGMICGLIMLSLSLAAAEKVIVPFREGNGKPEGILSADLPFYTGFHTLGKKEPCQVQTRFKIFHDGKYLYLGIEADEPGMVASAAVPRYPHDSNMIFRHDGIELNFDPSGKGRIIYKLMINPDGSWGDFRGIDDNTNSFRYVFDEAWDSHAKIATHQMKDKWQIEAAIPIGAFGEIPADSKLWRIDIGRTRLTGKKKSKPEMSSFSILSRPSFNRPHEFAQAELRKFDPKPYQWQLENLTGGMKKTAAGTAYAVSAVLLNRTGQFRFVNFRVQLLNEKQEVISESTRRVKTQVNQIIPVSLSIPTKASGSHIMQVDLYGSGGLLYKTESREVKLEYQPVRIVLTEPAYRDCIFASQPLKRIEACITLEEGIGKPLTVKLAGEGYEKTVTIPKTRAENRVSFPFENRKDGRYVLSAGGVSKTIRKLPFRQGEIWLDKDGIVYREGKKFLPFGWFSDTLAEKPYRGLNMTLNYGINHRDRDSVRSLLDRNYRAGRLVLAFPYQARMLKSAGDIFSDKAKQGALTGDQKKALLQYVEAIKDHPGFLGYYMADEPEGRNHNPNWYVQVREYLAEIDPYHPAVLLNCGISGIRRYYEGCDILMPDCYPVFFKDGSTFEPRRVSFDIASAASALRPAWFAPQAFDWDWNTDNKIGCAPSFDEVRNQILMGFAANVKGIVLYNYYSFGQLTSDLRAGTKYLAAEADILKDLLLSPTLKDSMTVKLSPGSTGFITAMKKCGNSFCIIAVNTENRTLKAEFTVKPAIGTKLFIGGENRAVSVEKKRFSDTFAPYAAHVYLTDPSLAAAYSLKAAREEIAQARKERFKPGNLAVVGELTLLEIKRRKKGIYPKNMPVMKVSSAVPVSFPLLDYAYFLQDGICEESPRVAYMSWMPTPGDRKPWAEITFTAPAEVDKVVLYCLTRNGRPALADGRITVSDGKTSRETARFTNNKNAVITLDFPKTKCISVRLHVDKIDRSAGCRLLSEFEVYGSLEK